jgi:molecular chaperone GrpE
MAKKKKETDKKDIFNKSDQNGNGVGSKEEQTSQSPDNKSAEAVEEYEAQISELKDKYLRLFAEFDNYKKRTARERLDIIRTATEELMLALLPVLDDFDRAKKLSDDENTEEKFSDGVNLVYQKLYSTLMQRGLIPMDSENQDFDSELHEAISKVKAPSKKLTGKIIDYIEKGYYLNDKIIRHAKVVIGE